MQFGLVNTSFAEGAILAHTVRLPGSVFRKGRVLSAADIATLLAAEIGEITAARLESGDVPENEAAARIAAKLSGDNIRVGAASTGRANLYSLADGLAVIEARAIDAVNAVDEAVTIATVAHISPIRSGQMLATVKIIPFAAPRRAVEEIEQALRLAPVTVRPFVAMKAALISTHLPNMKKELLDKNSKVIEARLRAVGSEIFFDKRVPHNAEALKTAIASACEAGCDPILVFGASAITDRRDVIPAAIEGLGGTVTHFGMPVDPGNLLLMGTLTGKTIVGLPGCARSPKLNGFDFVLWRLTVGIPVGREEIAAMGVGGLLSEIPLRPQPRDEVATPTASSTEIDAVILAAGMSSRMGSNKLLALVDGKPLVRHVAEAAKASTANRVTVVLGNEAQKVRSALEDLDIKFVENRDYSNGLSSSLKAGLNSLNGNSAGALIMLGDMPAVDSGLIDAMVTAFDPADGRAICVATRNGKRGNPFLWARRFYPELAAIEVDVGARSLIGTYNELVCEIETSDDAPLTDIDTPQALKAYLSR